MEIDTDIEFVMFLLQKFYDFHFHVVIRIVETVPKKMELGLKHAIDENPSIFKQFLWNFVKRTYPLVGQIANVSAWLAENCRFFINSLFFHQFHFFWYSLYFELHIQISFLQKKKSRFQSSIIEKDNLKNKLIRN